MRNRRAKPNSSPTAKAPSSQLRIIGGEWRSRKVPFVAQDGLRPTHDRVRETLFNWLQTQVPGAHCLDLFSGSGALGLEALSRGAESMIFIEQSSVSASQLKANLNTLKCTSANVINGDALQWLASQTCPTPIDIVFMDPPFNKDFTQRTCEALEAQGCLSQTAWIYVEVEKDLQWQPPINWRCHREKVSGQVKFSLYQRTAT
ncbi:MAG: 16S rRNA (guanine(966)-N(2))-methyltransferase RsmD [Pontibacterium sp.]